jgi:putative membrane protein insertion efficiency factor
MGKSSKIIRLVMISLIQLYRLLISPLLGQRCRFYPSCSSYMQQAIHQYGILRGIILGSRRLLRCHPYSEGGVDLVPNRK